MVVSVMAANTMGPAWFDGVTPITGPPRWTHLWEQGFPDLDALEGVSPRRFADGRRWSDPGGSTGWLAIVTRSVELFYELTPGTGGMWRDD